MEFLHGNLSKPGLQRKVSDMDYRTAGLRREEYEELKKVLGREPNETELRIMGVMWSEHCSYKSTKHLLRNFPTKGEYVVLGPGENAGVVNIGEGWGVAFKAESHNHPSAVAPYQGAATGVGGIIRDILALGARPVASMDGLFFGDPDNPRTRTLANGIVEGIGGYGNAVGVPTVGGKTLYDSCYTDNPLVNAFNLGLVRLDSLVSSQTAKPGLRVLILGSKTGRDGIAGAAFASAELSDDTKSSRPSIQIGDPFAEKLLIEACLELRDKGLIVSMQDMGAAGITSSSSEIAAKSGVGMILHFDKVLLREEGMTPWEIALSESQERMLLIVEPKDKEEVEVVAKKWELDCTDIGETVLGDQYTIMWGSEVVAEMPASLIGERCPSISWPSRRPENLENRWEFHIEELPLPNNFNTAILDLLGTPSLGDKKWIYQQYDQMVQTNTVQGPGAPVSVIRVKGTERLVAMVMDSDPWKCYLDPYRGGAESVAKTIRALTVAGALPLGLTDCLNFPSPEVPEQYWELEQVIKGMADCCRELECPVVSGNVSLYNESSSQRIYPTPVIGTVGVIDSYSSYLPSGQWQEGDILFLVGALTPPLSGSQYVLQTTGKVSGRPLPFVPEAEKDFCDRALQTAREGLARSGRAIAGGGLAIALAKEAIESGIGAAIACSYPTRGDVFLFGEGSPRAIYAVPSSKVDQFLSTWKGFPLMELGAVGGKDLTCKNLFHISVSALRQRWEGK